ncbi:MULTISPECIES: hypothetical protein [unclassified Bradyrhizobium]|uniref:hypothetical protein n=1 Tax=unclassified Bradyrhizobium TaxID=2631580 RepID=UPI0028ED22E6|nr:MULTISPECIES: hypothetical protein [unclassified Bradyrhizobium]
MHNRMRERAILRAKLEAGVNINMRAPRRIGKTWTIDQLAGDLRQADWQVVQMDVEGMRSSAEFAQALCQRIEAESSIRDRFRAHCQQRLSNVLGGKWGDRPIDALGKLDPIEFAGTLIASLAESGRKTAIIIDEIAYFFLAFAQAHPDDAHAFAYKMRGLQQAHRTVRWLLTGSIGLDIIARRYRLEGAFVDFDPFELQPFTGAEARSFLRDPKIQLQLTRAFDASDADYDWMFQDLGWLAPYYLKLIANEVHPSVAEGDGQPARATQDDFAAAFERLLQPDRRFAFAVWPEHIQKNFAVEDGALATGILDALSAAADGEIMDTLLARATRIQGSATPRQIRDILDMLMNDGLIARRGDRYGFRSGLVRRYWQDYQCQES